MDTTELKNQLKDLQKIINDMADDQDMPTNRKKRVIYQRFCNAKEHLRLSISYLEGVYQT